MNRDKQIEEVAKEFCPLFKEYGTCETCDAILDIGDNPCVHKNIASLIIAHDYRKASDVAREIIAEIDDALHNIAVEYHTAGHPEYYAVCEMVHHKVMRPIEKKYAEDEK